MYTMKDGKPFAFGGLGTPGRILPTASGFRPLRFITTASNELSRQIHDRMPVIINPSAYTRWLERDETHAPPVDLLRPYEAEAMKV